MAIYLQEEKLKEFLDSDYTVYGFCEKENIHARILLRTLEKHGLPRPDRKRKYAVGENHANWKGGRVIDKSGYILVYVPENPQANSHGYVREHRLVMENHMGRPLSQNESVHHKNHDKSDNRIENLVLFHDNAAHLREELKGKCPKWTDDGKRRLAASTDHQKKHGLPQSRKKIEKKDLLYLYQDCGLIVEAIAYFLSANHKTVSAHLKWNQIPVSLERGNKRLTPLGVQKLKENPLALKAYERGSPRFALHLKKILGIVDPLPLQKELQL